MAVKRNELKAPVLPKEAVLVEALGGEVVVRGLLLRERLALMGVVSDTAGAVDFAHVCKTLAICVLADDNEPVFSVDEWEAWGGQHMDAVLAMFSKAMELSGVNAEASKKS